MRWDPSVDVDDQFEWSGKRDGQGQGEGKKEIVISLVQPKDREQVDVEGGASTHMMSIGQPSVFGCVLLPYRAALVVIEVLCM